MDCIFQLFRKVENLCKNKLTDRFRSGIVLNVDRGKRLSFQVK